MHPDSSHFDFLRARGIDQHTLDAFGIEAHPGYHQDFPYWVYPVWDASGFIVGWRGKAMTKNAPKKYRWWTERMPSASWAFYMPRTIQPGKGLIIAAGEPDVWALTTLNIPAGSFLNGETSEPDSKAVGQIVARQPARCVVIYDNDEAGRMGSIKTVRALRLAGLNADAKALPSYLPSKGDITDLYAACGHDRAAFVEAMGTLSTIDTPNNPTSPRRKRANLPDVPGPISAFKEKYRLRDIAEQIVPLTVHASGRYLTGKCPFHDDHSPSFVVWPEIDKWRCFGCGKKGDQLDLIKEYKSAPIPMRAAS